MIMGEFNRPHFEEITKKDGEKGSSSTGKSGGVKLDAQKASEPNEKKGCCK